MLDRGKAEKVVIAGDFKHEFSKNLVDEWVEVKQVLRFLKDRVTPILVRGNHDNYLATILGDLNLSLNARADLGGYTIVHGHEEVSTLHPIIMGHEHPAGGLRAQLGAVVSVPAFLATDRLMVLPAFSPLALGADVSSYPYLSPILNRTPIDDARVIAVDEKEGLLGFGTLAGLKSTRPARLMKGTRCACMNQR